MEETIRITYDAADNCEEQVEVMRKQFEEVREPLFN